MLAIDCAENYGASAAKFKALGVDAVIRYFNPLSDGRDSGKSLTAAEAKEYAAAGLQVGIVVEGYGFANGTGVDGPSGTRDATEVLAWLPSVGIAVNNDLVVWFAVDRDTTAYQINNNVVAYFDAIKAVFGAVGNAPMDAREPPRIGVYGSGWTCFSMVGTRRADVAWVAGSTGWADYKSYVASNAWTLLQNIWPREVWNGFNCDTNQVNDAHGSPGFVTPFAASPVA
jgi:hypothetical protein